jgi:hypothetical protein
LASPVKQATWNSSQGEERVVPANAAAGPPSPFPGLRRDIMHPMFKELFIDTDADDLAAEDDRRRRMHRSRRARPAMIIRAAARHRGEPAAAVTTRRPQPNPGHNKNRMV